MPKFPSLTSQQVIKVLDEKASFLIEAKAVTGFISILRQKDES